ncbi:MAG: DUF4384 domain-containing protein [Elusimicrobiota bacterium]
MERTIKPIACCLSAVLLTLGAACGGSRPQPGPRAAGPSAAQRLNGKMQALGNAEAGRPAAAPAAEAAKPEPAAAAAEEEQPGDDDTVKVLKKDAAGCSWVESAATVSFGETDTRHQAKARAVAQARSMAMQKFLGVTLSHQTFDFQQEGLKGEVGLTENLLRATQHGRVLKENILSHGPKDLADCTGCMYAAHIRTCIVPLQDQADKGFRVELTLNRGRFVVGDEAEIGVTASRESYIYLYNVDMDWNASLMFPNVYFKDNRLEAGKRFVFPTEEMKRSLGLRITAQLPEGAEVSAEMIRVIAAKEPLPEAVLTGKGERQGGHAQSETRGTGTFLELMRRLSTCEAEWVDDKTGFTIYKK